MAAPFSLRHAFYARAAVVLPAGTFTGDARLVSPVLADLVLGLGDVFR